jgi:hypothetical protein
VFVSATGLLAAWWAYKRGLVEFRDFRCWLASHELVAQRCCMEKGRVPRYRLEEFDALVGGVGGEHCRASVRRLQAVGLLAWSERHVNLSVSLDSVRTTEPVDLQAKVESVTNHRRKIPVPRRLLRHLAASTRPVFVATALGHLLRCMYYRKGRCEPEGLCKASWIAGVFEVDERNVKAARQELIATEVLFRQPASQYRLNRWGVPIRFNLQWREPRATRPLPPRTPESTTQTPPLRETGISSFGRSENQKPARRASGVRKRTGRGLSLARVERSDLIDPARIAVLHAEAVKRSWCSGAEAARLKFFAAAAHAVRCGRKNPPGLFVAVIRGGLWHHASFQDEEVARRLLSGTRSDTPRPSPVLQSRTPAAGHEDPTVVRSLIARSLGGAKSVHQLSGFSL